MYCPDSNYIAHNYPTAVTTVVVFCTYRLGVIVCW